VNAGIGDVKGVRGIPVNLDALVGRTDIGSQQIRHLIDGKDEQ
jgi:hypothetical protein